MNEKYYGGFGDGTMGWRSRIINLSEIWGVYIIMSGNVRFGGKLLKKLWMDISETQLFML
jgi:hypothetical protein